MEAPLKKPLEPPMEPDMEPDMEEWEEDEDLDFPMMMTTYIGFEFDGSELAEIFS